MKSAGDPCGACTGKRPLPLKLVRGVLVCETCDAVASWPAVNRGEA